MMMQGKNINYSPCGSDFYKIHVMFIIFLWLRVLWFMVYGLRVLIYIIYTRILDAARKTDTLNSK